MDLIGPQGRTIIRALVNDLDFLSLGIYPLDSPVIVGRKAQGRRRDRDEATLEPQKHL